MHRRLPRILMALGTVLLTLGLLAGIVNHEVIDGKRFADHVDAIRKDPDVARQVGKIVTQRVLEADPDLVAIGPLLEPTFTSLVGSPTFSPIVRRSAEQLHNAFTESSPPVLRLADVGAVLSAVLVAVSPTAASKLPPDLDVTLASVGSQTFAAGTIHLARLVRLMAWLLPVLALLCFAAGLWLTGDWRRYAPTVGRAVFGSGLLLAAFGVVAWALTSYADTNTLGGALTVAVWHELRGPLWWTAAGTLVAGAVVALALESGAALDVWRFVDLAWAWMRRSTGSLQERVARAGLFVVLGLAFVLRPQIMMVVLGALLGVALLTHGALQMLRLTREVLASRRRSRGGWGQGWNPRWTRTIATGLGVALLVGLFVFLARPVDSNVVTAVQTAIGRGPCNGHVQLCDRRYDQVAFPSTHNSMSAADEGWFLAEQPTGLVGQLDAGVRALLIDTWYGQATQRPGVVATAPINRDQARAELESELSPEVVQSALRLRSAASLTPTGPVEPYLCHGLCELGASKFEPDMEDVRAWLEANPREVVTLFIQDEVSPADTAKVFEEAGLLPYVHTQEPGQPWPTLREMISSGRRLVVLMENHGGGTTYPWLLQGFDWVQDTPYDFSSASDFSCKLFRGKTDSPLFLLNHWLNRFQARVSDSAKVNAYDVLWPRASECEKERGMIPNFVSVNFYDKGDLFGVVDQLNGFR